MKIQREEIIGKIKSWLQLMVDEHKGASFERFLDSQTDSNSVVFKVTNILTRVELNIERQTKQYPLVYFVTLLEGVDIVHITTYLKFTESDNTGFKILLPPAKLKFVNLLKNPLLTLNVDYSWLPEVNDFDSLEISKDIYYDGFNKNSFFDALSSVLRAYEITYSGYIEFRNSISDSRKNKGNTFGMR